jgi:DNA-binding CsgD family transcriptional regulator
MVRARQLRDAAALAHELDLVDDAPALGALLSDAMPRIVACDGVMLATDLSDVVVDRRSRGFDDDELALIELLRAAILAAARRVATSPPVASAGLTAREAQVLGRVAAGDTNALIAHRLGMRPRTVAKHLEHAYAKLGVSSRTAAVARLRGIAY